MLKRYVIALSVTAAALLLPAGAAQAADDTSAATTVTTTTGGEGSTATSQTPRQIVTPSGHVVTVGATTNGRLRDTNDSSWGG